MNLSKVRKFLLLFSIVVLIACGLFLYKAGAIFEIERKQARMDQFEQKKSWSRLKKSSVEMDLIPMCLLEARRAQQRMWLLFRAGLNK